MLPFFRVETTFTPSPVAQVHAGVVPEASTTHFFKRLGLFDFLKRQTGELKQRTSIATEIDRLHVDPVEFDHSEAFSTSSQESPSQILSGESTCGTSSPHVQSIHSNSPSSAEAPQTPKKEKHSWTFSIFAATPNRPAVKREWKASKGNARPKIGRPQNVVHLCHGVIVELMVSNADGYPQKLQLICRFGNASNYTSPAVNNTRDVVGDKFRKEFDKRVEGSASTYSMRPQESQDIGCSPSSPTRVSTRVDKVTDTPPRPKSHASTGGSSVSPQKRKPVPSM